MKVDLAIIGGGGAGLPGALAAHEKGLSVAIIEKRGSVGGNAAMAEGFFAAQSPVQDRLLINARKDELYKTALDYAHYKVNPRLLRVFINRSGETVRWLEKKGVAINRVAPFYPNQVPLVWHILEGHGASLVKILEKEITSKGISIFRKTRATKITTDDKGRISGVVAEGENGEFFMEAKCVLIATGGFASNSEMLRQYCPDLMGKLDNSGVPGMDGDGLKMAMSLGAGTDGLGHLLMVGPSPFPKSWAIEGVSGEPYAVWVNKKGERFVDETVTFNVFEAINAIVRQKEGICYAIIDSRMKARIREQGLLRGCGELFVPRGKPMEDLDNDFEKQIQKGGAFESESLGEIAQWIGAPRENLVNTIEEYNICCDAEYDEIFVKDRRYLQPLRMPPYYAIRFRGSILVTSGGIKINHRMQVMDKEDNPIPGLFAAGADTGGWESDTYCALLSGSAFGFALNSGRIAAESALEYMQCCPSKG